MTTMINASTKINCINYNEKDNQILWELGLRTYKSQESWMGTPSKSYSMISGNS
ncbi:hypothetical protein PL8927_900074 [Planktothrix serta PCC 8927]|uniref:Uncharacterized protein n=1 Tax=Planktothrix serta PCC 8927 TaxID=671068 RepID=A0A7Z9E592_9CYAN|nr:hypothetical protein PL8927_900074 [Planktothrix serta PCC 8927]